MSQINPYAASVIGATQVQRAGTEKVRRTQNLTKNSALAGDTLEHQVESTDALHAAGDEDQHSNPQQQQRRDKSQQRDDSAPPRIDLTA